MLSFPALCVVGSLMLVDVVAEPVSRLRGTSGHANVSARCKEARDVLDGNWDADTGTTKPSKKQYPHQWNWDTGFIAIGHAGFNVARAKAEIEHLFSGQWQNGMVPHTVFNPNAPPKSYFPAADWWQSSQSAQGNAPLKPETSGLTNPPVVARAVLTIGGRDEQFMKDMFPKLDKYLTYFHDERNPTGTGLVYVRHPWENGMDNLVIWDKPLYQDITASMLSNLPHYERLDLKHGVNPKDRPSNAFYDRVVYLLVEARKRNYSETTMWEDGLPFAVYDSLMNALVLMGYEDMVEMAKQLGNSSAAERYQQWASELADAMETELWDDELGLYVDQDAVGHGEKLRAKTYSGLAPLFYTTLGSKTGNQRKQHLRRMLLTMNSSDFCSEGCYMVPSLARDDPRFDAQKYWRGPVWINIEWLLIRGLEKQASAAEAEGDVETSQLAGDLAKRIKKDVMTLVGKYGMVEYFNPMTGEPHGIASFSWTAALYHDLFCTP